MSDSKGTAILSKVPELTLVFWIIKIFATTLGETGGDTLSMSMDLGYLTSSLIFGVIFLAFLAVQMRSLEFKPWVYWATIIATTTVGTTLADFADRSLDLGYTGGSTLLLALLMISLGIWRWVTGSIAVTSVQNTKSEFFYWITLLFSQTLGTALGDWMADDGGFGYAGSTVVFGGALALLGGMYLWTHFNRTVLFWLAFVLTRPLGAVVGDLLDKPLEKGGLDLSRPWASALLLIVMLALIRFFPNRAAQGSK